MGIFFLAHKGETFEIFEKFYKKVENEKELHITSIRNDHKREFENKIFENFCESHVISHNFSCPKTP